MTTRKMPNERAVQSKWYNSAVAATVVGVCLTALIAIAANLFLRLNELEVKMGKIEQRLADGGTHEIVEELDNANNPMQVAAAMTTLHGAVLSASLSHAPNPQKIEALAPAVLSATRKFPEVPASWQTVATLASYRTLDINVGSQGMPDCDVNVKARPISASEIHGLPHLSPYGYINGFMFRDCKLHMNHLPDGYFPPTDFSKVSHTPQSFPAGTPVYQINEAFVVGCEIILDDTGIADSPIAIFNVANSRFSYNVEQTPSPSTQKLLLASLESSVAGGFSLDLKSRT